MADSDSNPRYSGSFVERRARRIANNRSVTLGLALTFVFLSLAGAVVMRLADHREFPSLGIAVWWALQTFTTVGYGDIVPTTNIGMIVGSAEMVIGVSFIAFLTATVTSAVIRSGDAEAHAAADVTRDQHTEAIIAAVGEATAAIAELNRRLDRIESRLR